MTSFSTARKPLWRKWWVGVILGVGTILLFWWWIANQINLTAIRSGSMAPAIRKGSLAISTKANLSGLKPGDVIIYRPPLRERILLTHRIVSVHPIDDTTRYFITKGDANPNGDPWPVDAGTVRGKIIGSIPLLGYVLLMLHHPAGFLIMALVTLMGIIWIARARTQ